jgi:N-acetylneuraminic acid mutarotase
MRSAAAWITVGMLGLAACGDDGPSGAHDAATGGDGGAPGWTTGAPVPSGPLQETAAVAIDGKIYVIGGLDGAGGTVASVLVYDVGTNTWASGPDLPRNLHHASAATVGGTIYVVGALGPSFNALADVYAWNPATDSGWTSRAALPTGRERGAGVTGVIDGKIYVAGGFRSGARAQVDVYDPIQDEWASVADLPAARDHACGGVIDGKLIVAGGRNPSPPQPDTWSYDPGANAWMARAPMPTGRAGTGCGIIDGKLYVTGGEGNSSDPAGMYDDVEAFDAAANMWTVLSAMPNKKHGVGGAVWDGALYLCGGADREGFAAVAGTDIFRP